MAFVRTLQRLLLCGLAALPLACGADEAPSGGSMSSDDSQTSTSIPTHTYSGPGSFYRATLDDDGEFTIEVSDAFDTPVLMTITGTYVRLPTGFLQLTIGAVTSSVSGAPIPGDTAHALELPGFALFLNPAGSSEVIPMLITDACPTADFGANWIMVRGEDGRDATHPDREWFGTFSYLHGAAPEARIPSRRNLSDLSPLLDAPAAIEVDGCTTGHLPVRENGRLTANMWLTNGGAIVETFVSDGTQQTLVAMRQPASVAMTDLSGDYAALFVGDDVQAGKVMLDQNGSGSASVLDDVTSTQTPTTSLPLTLSPAASMGDGWLAGQLDGQRNIACSALPDAGESNRTVMVCIGQDPDDATKPIAILMASVE